MNTQEEKVILDLDTLFNKIIEIENTRLEIARKNNKLYSPTTKEYAQIGKRIIFDCMENKPSDRA